MSFDDYLEKRRASGNPVTLQNMTAEELAWWESEEKPPINKLRRALSLDPGFENATPEQHRATIKVVNAAPAETWGVQYPHAPGEPMQLHDTANHKIITINADGTIPSDDPPEAA
jgi:hypothetical protein